MAEVDPFDEAPFDAEIEESKGDVVVNTKSVDGVVKVKSVDGEGKIVLTFKEGGGFDASWNVVHASTVEEAKSILSDPQFKDLLDQQKKVAAYFRGGGTAPSLKVNQPNPSYGAPAGAQEPPAWAPEKPFPDFVYKSGVSQKTGKPWQAWMSPTRGDGRAAVFFDPPR